MSRQITATEKLRAVKNGLLAESEFTRQMRQLYPMYVSPHNGYKDTVQILKNRGMLFEEKEEDNSHKFSPEALQRGQDFELTKKGILYTDASKDEREKAEKLAIKNLKKDVLYYINHIAGESSKVDKHDKPVETKRGAKDVDSFNGLKKAELKEEVLDEGAVKNKIYAYAERIFNDFIKARQSGAQITFEDMLGSINANDATNMGMDYKFYSNNKMNILNALNDMSKPSNVRLKAILKRGIETIKAKYPSVDQSDIMDFIRTHRNDVLGGVDIADEFEEFADANNILVKEPKGGLDKEPGIGAMSVKDIEALPNEDDPITGKKVVMFKEDDIEEKMSDEFMDQAKNYGKQNAFNPKPYKIGDMWSSDFDYHGMLQAGLRVRINTPLEQLKQLYYSFEDVNYHSENRYLGVIIDAIEAGDKKEALDAIKDYKFTLNRTLMDIKEGLSDMERNETVDEIEIEEKKGKDHDGDGDVDGDDYMHAKDKAIKKSMGKNVNESTIKKAVKTLIKDILTEAYTGRLQGYVDGKFDPETKVAAKELMGVLEAMESDFLKHKEKIANAYEKAGSFLAPALQSAFLKDLTNQRLSYDKVELPKTRRLSPEEEDMIKQQRVSEEDKQTVFSKPMNEKK